MKTLNKSGIFMGRIIFVSLLVFTALALFPQNANAVYPPACPFAPQSGRTIVNLGGISIRSDEGADRAYVTVPASLPAGTYDVSLQSFDDGTASSRSQHQPNERFYLQLKSGSTIVAQTASTTDLPDGVATPEWHGLVNSNLVLSQSVNTITAVHSAYPNKSSANSVHVGCVAFDLKTPPVPTLSVSCSANPGSIQTSQSSTFTANATGGTGSYVYSWSGACTSSGSTCSNTFSAAGTQTATVNVTSGNQTKTADCSVAVNQPTPNLTVSCSASPASINTNQSSTFTASASGGNGSYVYSWSGACTGSGQTCSNTFNTQGTQTAGITVTSGAQSASATCPVNIGQSCTPNYQQRCVGNSLYWYDSCGAQGSYIGSCGQTYNNVNLTVTKTVRDLTTGTGFSNLTYANPSDTLMFLITLQANGNQEAQNVFVRDTLPPNLIYNNQLIIACSGGSNCNNNYNNNYNNSGSIAYGINLGTIYAGQTATISYQVQVASAANFSFGTTTLNNNVLATSSNAGTGNASASVIVSRTAILGASTVSTGLTNNFWVDSFFLPLFIALIGVWMWRSGMFFGIEKWLDNKKKVRRGYKAEKELSSRIAKLQKSGKA